MERIVAMGKPTMQDIANAVSTSRISVWKALNNRPGISKELREQVYQVAQNLGYFKNTAHLELSSDKIHKRQDSAKATAKTIAAVVSRPESSLFWMKIIHQIAKDLSAEGINLMYIYLPGTPTPSYYLPSSLTDGSLSGIIVLNVYTEKLMRLLSELPVPKVFLDKIPTIEHDELNGDLVLIEGRSVLQEITGKLLDRGITRLGFFGDIHYAQTNMDRYNGFVDAFVRRGIKVDPGLSMIGSLHLHTHYEEICAFLDSLKELPEGFVCASDYIAHFIERYFISRGAVRSSILTGFDNNHEYGNIAGRITTVDVQTHTLGSRLVNKILFAIQHPEAAYEVSYVGSEILYLPPLKD